MESCYIPNNPQFGLSLEYTAYNSGGTLNGTITGYPGHIAPCDTGQHTCCGCSQQGCPSCAESLQAIQHCGERFVDCDGRCGGNCDRDTNANVCESRDANLTASCDVALEDNYAQSNSLANCDGDVGSGEVILESDSNLVSLGAGTAFWSAEDMGSFSLPPLDLEPMPYVFPFSPCSGANYKSGECRVTATAAQGDVAADVVVSLKHGSGVVLPADCGADCGPAHEPARLAGHPAQMMVSPGSGGYPYYEQYGAAPLFPTMSVNVSMNMTMHGCPPDQVCSQVQWKQNTNTSFVNLVYPPNQGVLSPPEYSGGATYSFTADFRSSIQTDSLITTTSSLKPSQITTAAPKTFGGGSNYNIFTQKQIQNSFGSFHGSLNQKSFAQGSISGPLKLRPAKIHLSPEHSYGSNTVNGYASPIQQIEDHEFNYGSIGLPAPGGKVVQVGSLSGY